jgi:hypothetical protein
MRSNIEGTAIVTGCRVPVLIVKSVRNGTTGRMNNTIHAPYADVLTSHSVKRKQLTRVVRKAVWDNGRGDIDGLNRHLTERGYE